MSTFFVIVLLLSIIAFVVGLIRPAWIHLPSRKRAAQICGVVIIVSFILTGITSSYSTHPASTVAGMDQSSTTSTTLAQSAPGAPRATPPSQKDQIKATVSAILQGSTNISNESYLRNITVTQDDQGSYDVAVEFNGDNNLTENMTKGGIETKMSDVYTALYTDNLNVQSATISAFLNLTDKYGNSSDQMVYKSTLDEDTASMVNWSTDKATLELQILPGVWTTDYDLFAIDPNL